MDRMLAPQRVSVLIHVGLDRPRHRHLVVPVGRLLVELRELRHRPPPSSGRPGRRRAASGRARPRRPLPCARSSSSARAGGSLRLRERPPSRDRPSARSSSASARSDEQVRRLRERAPPRGRASRLPPHRPAGEDPAPGRRATSPACTMSCGRRSALAHAAELAPPRQADPARSTACASIAAVVASSVLLAHLLEPLVAGAAAPLGRPGLAGQQLTSASWWDTADSSRPSSSRIALPSRISRRAPARSRPLIACSERAGASVTATATGLARDLLADLLAAPDRHGHRRRARTRPPTRASRGSRTARARRRRGRHARRRAARPRRRAPTGPASSRPSARSRQARHCPRSSPRRSRCASASSATRARARRPPRRVA